MNQMVGLGKGICWFAMHTGSFGGRETEDGPQNGWAYQHVVGKHWGEGNFIEANEGWEAR